MNLPTPKSSRLLLLQIAFLGLATAARAQTILPDPTAGQPYSFQIVTSPPQPAGTAYAADGLPSGLSIDSSTGVVSGTTGTVGTFDGNLHLSLEFRSVKNLPPCILGCLGATERKPQIVHLLIRC